MVDKKKKTEKKPVKEINWNEALYHKLVGEGVDAEDATKEACK